jgi:beta-1,2-mannobiose phosphorylase / 1,2-beta-oligomannan phosphorylase
VSVSDQRYRIERHGVLVAPRSEDPLEAWGVLNPASARGRDGELYLFPRLVAEGNVSRIGRCIVRFDDAGVPCGVERLGLALEPDELWEGNVKTRGVEDPRITYVPHLDRYVMAYAAYGPYSARVALAVSDDLERWRRLGPVAFAYDPALRADLNLYPNKDAFVFPEPVLDPAGEPALALLHRPTWDLAWAKAGEGTYLPDGVDEPRPGIWVSYAPLAGVEQDIRELTRVRHHRPVAVPEQPWEALKIGGGTPPILTADGWCTVFHGVSGRQLYGVDHQPHVRYVAGVMVHALDDVARVVHRSAEPLLQPDARAERDGIVNNVVFPTAIEPTDGGAWVFYGMADTRIGVARLWVDPSVSAGGEQ